MIMKLKNILFFASFLGCLALSSCTGNFLDEDRNPNSLDPENFWKSESDILKGLTAAYAGLQPTIEWAQPFERYIVIDNYRSDELNFGHGFDEPLHFGQNRFLTPIQIDITIIMNWRKLWQTESLQNRKCSH